MLQIIQADWPACKVIFLTGYNDFHYIRSAMAYGGFDYILKVESDDKIIASVERALEKLEEEGKHLRMLERANRRMREALPLLQKEYIWDLLQGKQETPEELARHFEELGILLRADLARPAAAWKGGYVEGIVYAHGQSAAALRHSKHCGRIRRSRHDMLFLRLRKLPHHMAAAALGGGRRRGAGCLEGGVRPYQRVAGHHSADLLSACCACRYLLRSAASRRRCLPSRSASIC